MNIPGPRFLPLLVDAIGSDVLSSIGKIGDQRNTDFPTPKLLAPKQLLGNTDIDFQG